MLAAGNDFGVANELGLCAMRSDDPGAAVGYFEKASRINSQPFVAYNLACALARGVPFRYINVKKDPAELQRMLEVSNGQRRVPVIVEHGKVTIGFGGT